MTMTLAEQVSRPVVAWEPPQIPLLQIEESEKNPRKFYSESGMAELLTSVKAGGVRTPLLLRIVDESRYVIAAGHRRRRAAIAAGLETVPAVAREMTDEEFLELLSFENGGREDVRPLEEAAGWKLWMEETGATAAEVGAKAGVSARQVYDRLGLLRMDEEIQRALEEERITVGHAVLLARVEDRKERLQMLARCGDRPDSPISVRALKRMIVHETGRDLDRAVFALDDAGLPPMPCTECSFRTAPGEGEPVCFRPACFDAKVQAHIERAVKEQGLVAISTHYRAADVPAGVLQQAEYAWVEEERYEDEIDDQSEADGVELPEEAPADCGHSVEAIVAHGHDVGKTMRVCTDAKCPVHGEELRANREDAGAREEKWKRERALEDQKRKVRTETRRRALRAILEGWKEASPPQLGAVLLEERLAGYYDVDPLKELDRMAPYLAKTEKKAAKLDQHVMLKALREKAAADPGIVPRVLVYFALYKGVENNWGGDRRDCLAAAAAVCGVDLKAIEKRVKAGEPEPGPVRWPEPDASGYFTHGAEMVKCDSPGGHKADVVLVQVKDGWYRGHEVRAGKVTSTRRPAVHGEKYAKRMEALAAAAEEIGEWARGQAQNGATNAARNQARLIVLWAGKLRKDTGVPEAAPAAAKVDAPAKKKAAQTSAKKAPAKKAAKAAKKKGRK